MASRYVPNPRFEDEALRMPGVIAQVARAAAQVASQVEGAAVFPGGRGAKRTVISDGTRPGAKRVGIAGPFGAIEEFGSINSAPKAPLAQGVQAVGLEFSEA